MSLSKRRQQKAVKFKLSDIGKKRIPTLIGLMVLVLGLGTGLFLVGRATIVPRAVAGETPKQIRITNVSENSFTVSWVTDLATVGFVRFGESQDDLNQTVADDRDQLSGNVDSFETHYVTVRNLQSNKSYYFKLGSGTGRVLYDNNGQAYLVKTPTVLGSPPAADTVYGKVYSGENVAAEGAIVYVSLPNAAPLSSLVKASGDWAVSLATSRSSDLSAFVPYDRQATTLSLFVQATAGQTATAVTVTANDSPVPAITLGNAHDFTSDVPVTSDLAGEPGELPPGADVGGDLGAASEEGGSSDEGDDEEEDEDGEAPAQFSLDPLGPTLPSESTFVLEILNPEADGEQVATSRPEIFGTSPKNVTLSIMVESPITYTDEVVVGEDGLWQWSPPQSLDPGEHTVTVSYTDENGLVQQELRNFVVLAAGTEAESFPAFEATPSGEATESATPSGVPRVSQPSTESGVPTAGVMGPTLLVLFAGTGLMFVGAMWKLGIVR